MTARRVLYAVCALLLVGVVVLRAMFSGGGQLTPAIAMDDEAVSNLQRFVATLDTARIEDVRKALPQLPTYQPDRFPKIYQAILDISGKSEVRQAAMAAWRRTQKMDVDTLADLLREHEDESIRIQAIAEIESRDLWDGVPHLVEAMRDKQRRVRVAAHEAIGDLMGFKFNFDPDAGESHWLKLKGLYLKQWDALRPYAQQQQRLKKK